MGDRQIFIGNLCNVSTDLLRSYCESYGVLTEVSLNRDKENNVYHCFAFVTFQSSRSASQFMSNRPHCINGDEVFVKRALPRSTSSIPERLIVTNRLVLHDSHHHEKYHLRNYFQKLGSVKKFDIEKGFIDYEDYDDVDRILLARPHYIRDKEISVTKFIPSDYHDHSDSHYSRSNQRHSKHRSNTSRHSRHSHSIERPERIITISNENITRSSNIAFVDQSSHFDVNVKDDEEEEEEEQSGELVANSNDRYEQLQGQFEEYKQKKEMEICNLKKDLERTQKQLADLTQNKLDRLLKNQQTYHDELLLRLCPNETFIEDFFSSSSNQWRKKRKLTSSPIHQEYEFYS